MAAKLAVTRLRAFGPATFGACVDASVRPQIDVAAQLSGGGVAVGVGFAYEVHIPPGRSGRFWNVRTLPDHERHWNSSTGFFVHTPFVEPLVSGRPGCPVLD